MTPSFESAVFVTCSLKTNYVQNLSRQKHHDRNTTSSTQKQYLKKNECQHPNPHAKILRVQISPLFIQNMK